MRLLVLGSSGLLGSNVVSAAMSREWDVMGTYHSDSPGFDIRNYRLDIRDAERFAEVLDRVEPEAVVNCAAMTDVDACEQRPELAHAVNGTAPGEMADICSAESIAFSHISTDYVFDGTRVERYSESATPGPLQEYGESKLAGDRAVRDTHPSALIVRPSFVYGLTRPDGSLAGFPAWVRSQLQSDESVSLFNDQHVTPSRAGQVASILLQLLSHGESGLFNVACRTCTTPYEFGFELRSRLGQEDTPLEAVSKDSVDRPAHRPGNTCLDVSAVERRLGMTQPTLEDDISAIESELTAT